MTATYTFDVFSSLDGFGGARDGSWGGYWGKQGPELLDHRLASYGGQQRIQVTLFPVITGQTGDEPIFQGAADFDLELIDSRTLDGSIQELIYTPALHV